MLLTLDSKIEHIAAQTAAKRASQEEHDKALQSVLKEVTDRKDKGGHRKGTIDRDNMLMDVDDVLEQAKGKNRKFVFNSPILILSGSLVTVKMTERRRRLYLSNNGSAINFRRHRPMQCIIIATSVYVRKCVLVLGVPIFSTRDFTSAPIPSSLSVLLIDVDGVPSSQGLLNNRHPVSPNQLYKIIRWGQLEIDLLIQYTL